MLFANSQVVGTFKGFNEKGLEFAAEIVAPYDASMLDRPQLGQFLLIELGSQEEASLGRITRFVPSGLLATAEGEDYVNTMQRRQQSVPEDLKQQRLKYRVQVKLLGAVRSDSGKILYVPSQRRLPHLGAKVALPSPSVLQELCRLSQGETDIGDYVLGEFVYSGASALQSKPELRSMDPKLTVTFDIKNLVSRRSVVFARAGYGKSNLIKFLISELYRLQPKTDSGLSVGTLIFDPDGEYFWPDTVKKRPGLCDVPHLQDKLVVFTNRPAPSPYYGSWKLGEVKLDIRELPPRDVIGLAVSSERQTQQNVLKLKSLSSANWRELVDLVFARGLQAPDEEIGELLGYSEDQIDRSQAEIGAARSNMYNVVRSLHDPNSRVLSGTIEALSNGSIVVLDISLLSTAAGNMLAGLLLRRIFSHNQENFTGGQRIIPTVAIIEEAQSVLGRNLDDTSPYVEWVKEGRKYDLGAMLVTQQPGSMAPELLSQADNWFCFHLLSEGDAGTLGKYNSHFSDDILAHLIAEPIAGNCYMWSAPHQPFVLPVRVRSFEDLYGQYVNSDAAASSVEGTRAQAVSQAVSSSLDRLKDALIEALKERTTRFVSIPNALPGGADGIGVKSGQLYFLIKGIKTASDTQSEEQLKKALMPLILGEGNFQIVPYQGADYYCATIDRWEKALGVRPKVSLS
jgi:DNA helicase HerA-like ATPase